MRSKLMFAAVVAALFVFAAVVPPASAQLGAYGRFSRGSSGYYGGYRLRGYGSRYSYSYRPYYAGYAAPYGYSPYYGGYSAGYAHPTAMPRPTATSVSLTATCPFDGNAYYYGTVGRVSLVLPHTQWRKRAKQETRNTNSTCFPRSDL